MAASLGVIVGPLQHRPFAPSALIDPEDFGMPHFEELLCFASSLGRVLAAKRPPGAFTTTAIEELR
jgi:hypothetical protein